LLAVAYQVNDADFLRLTELLANRQADMMERSFAALALGLSARPEAIEKLSRRLREPMESPDVRVACAAGLQLYGGSGAVDPLSAEVRDVTDLVPVRTAAALALGKMGDVCGISPLLDLAGSTSADLRRSAVIALGSLCANYNEEEPFTSVHRGAIQKCLTSAFLGDVDPKVRGFAAISIGQLGGSAARTFLARAFEFGSMEVRPAVAIGLGIVGDRTASGPLLKTFDDGKMPPSLRAASAIGLGLLGERGAAKALEAAAASASELVLRRAAVLALGMIRDTSAIPLLSTTLREGSPPAVADECAAALALIGSNASRTALRDAHRTAATPHLRVTIARNLALARDVASSPVFRDVIGKDSATEEEQVGAVQALGLLYDHSTSPDLAYYAWDTDCDRTDTVREQLKRYL
jgi:HEAT repeat protein